MTVRFGGVGLDEELIELERRGWRALSTSGVGGERFLRRRDRRRGCHGAARRGLVDDRAALLESVGGQPWSSYRLSSINVLWPTPDVAIVAYEATAERDGMPTYEALMSTTYVRRDDGWRMVFHQQTPHWT